MNANATIMITLYHQSLAYISVEFFIGLILLFFNSPFLQPSCTCSITLSFDVSRRIRAKLTTNNNKNDTEINKKVKFVFIHIKNIARSIAKSAAIFFIFF